MKSDPAICVKNLGKSYRIFHQKDRKYNYQRFSEDLSSWVSWPLRKTKDFFNNKQSFAAGNEEFWALRDVSFEARQGEVIGIIGRNGAGKSTLLKILSRIIHPTCGRVEITGRVASLLEVGTGFHPELTGRENIFLNGAILGMTRAEIRSKFDEITDFAEIEKFLDTPVKRYSSGMYVRLAFAVAAHLEPEILLVDEVLAVGDFSFQKKCLGKMGDISRQHGRLVVFVSHNMGAVRQLCQKGLYIDHGRIVATGDIESVIAKYLKGASSKQHIAGKDSNQYITGIEFFDLSENNISLLLAGESGFFRINYDTGSEVLLNIGVTIALYDPYGVKVAMLCTHHACEKPFIQQISGQGHIDCKLTDIPLTTGKYQVNVAFDGDNTNGRFHDGIVDGCQLSIIPSDYLGPSRLRENESGFVLIKQQWTVN